MITPSFLSRLQDAINLLELSEELSALDQDAELSAIVDYELRGNYS